MPDSFCIAISAEHHVAEARRDALLLAQQLGFRRTDAYYLGTAVTELATNILRHAGCGEIQLSPLTDHDIVGIEVIASDSGPGIANIELALRDGYSTTGGLGGGLPGVIRLMDQVEIHSEPGQGTCIHARKWATPWLTPNHSSLPPYPVTPC